MIDWVYVGLSALWIAGLSLALAVLGIAYATASASRQRLGNALGQKYAQLFLNLGLVLFCGGLAGLASTWWEKLLWALLGAGFLFSAWRAVFFKPAVK